MYTVQYTLPYIINYLHILWSSGYLHKKTGKIQQTAVLYKYRGEPETFIIMLSCFTFIIALEQPKHVGR